MSHRYVAHIRICSLCFGYATISLHIYFLTFGQPTSVSFKASPKKQNLNFLTGAELNHRWVEPIGMVKNGAVLNVRAIDVGAQL